MRHIEENSFDGAGPADFEWLPQAVVVLVAVVIINKRLFLYLFQRLQECVYEISIMK